MRIWKGKCQDTQWIKYLNKTKVKTGQKERKIYIYLISMISNLERRGKILILYGENLIISWNLVVSKITKDSQMGTYSDTV